jgi:hypothetical protein
MLFLISAVTIGAIITLNLYKKDSQPESEKDLKDDVFSYWP